MAHPLLADTPGETHLLLGNEAIVRGALEAGVACVTCYPGTPSSEVPDTFYRLSPEGGYTFEYSVNEKVALEVGGGATLAGAMTLTTMKHVGVNVAADPLLTLCYIGSPGGFVLLSADDPGCHSSQNEQDNRIYARLAGMPVFEPATAQEAKDMTRDALLLSRELEQPVLLRTTTRVNHLRGPVTFGGLPPVAEVKRFEKNVRRFVPVPAVARARHPELLRHLEEAREVAESSAYNRRWGSGSLGVVASGICRAYLADVVAERRLDDAVAVYELGLSYPLPGHGLTAFLRSVDRCLILEEGEPVVETELRALCQREGIETEIVGKQTPGREALLSRMGEYATANIRAVLHALLDVETSLPVCKSSVDPASLPMRPPNLCAGCSHRALYLSVRELYGDAAVYSSDIGCYTLGLLPPLSCADFLLCMGSSVSAGSGFARFDDRPVVAFIGDSTFFHSGVTGLINAVFNDHDLLLVVLDNRTTAMTGHQPNPGVDTTVLGQNEAKVDIEAICKGCGVTDVVKVKPSNVKATQKALAELKSRKGVRVLVAEEPCVLFARRVLKDPPTTEAYVAEQSEAVEAVVAKLACPGFYRDEKGGVAIESSTCTGCMVCTQVVGEAKGQIKARKKSAAKASK